MANVLKKCKILLPSYLIFWSSLVGQNPNPPNLVLYDLQPFHLGFSVGVNFIGFFAMANPGYSIKSIPQPELNINAVMNFRLGRNIDLRMMPGFRLGQRELMMTGPIPVSEASFTFESNSLELPVDIKYRFHRAGNHRQYVVTGINPQIELSGGYSSRSWSWGTGRLIKPLDFCLEIGTGWDFFLPRNKLAAELKFSIGILNVYSGDNKNQYSDLQILNLGLDQLFSRKVILRFQID